VNNSPFNQLVSTKHGLMLVNKNDIYVGRSLILYGEISEAENAIYKQLCNNGDTIVEVGANIGAHSLSIAKSIGVNGKLFCYEPQQIVFQTLNANLALNSITNTTTFQLGVASKESSINVEPINYTTTANFGGISLKDIKKGEKIDVVSLDKHLNLQSLKLLKIDVEGMEIDVLLGAKKTIEKFQPIIYCENDRIDSSKELIQLIQSYGYDLYWHLPALFNSENFNNVKENVFKNIVSVNLLCLPKDSKLHVENFTKVIDSNEHPMKRKPTE